MKREFKERWIEALKSGKYKKGSGALRRNFPDGSSSFCCLGVALDIKSPNCWMTGYSGFSEITATGNRPRWKNFGPSEDGVKLDEEIGLECGSSATLAAINDDSNLSFDEVIEFIKKLKTED